MLLSNKHEISLLIAWISLLTIDIYSIVSSTILYRMHVTILQNDKSFVLLRRVLNPTIDIWSILDSVCKYESLVGKFMKVFRWTVCCTMFYMTVVPMVLSQIGS